MSGRLLLCTDLDRTLIPNGSEPESPGARALFGELVARPGVSLVYVTGRDRSLVEEAIEAYALPRPGCVVGDVGTTIYDTREDEWIANERWQTELRGAWIPDAHAQIARALSGLPRLERQEDARQGAYKSSFYVPLELGAEELIGSVEARCASIGLEPSVVYSVDEERRVGLLDILPARASKLHAIRFIMRESAYSVSETVFCGDSGNDMSVLVSDIPGVLVANAAPGIRDETIELASRLGNLDALYVCRGSFLNMNGNYAAGMLEGIAHFHPALRDWFSERLAEVSGA